MALCHSHLPLFSSKLDLSSILSSIQTSHYTGRIVACARELKESLLSFVLG